MKQSNQNEKDQKAPGLFATSFIKNVPVSNIPEGYYDPKTNVYMDKETNTPMWADKNKKKEKTTCSRATGLKSTQTPTCVSTDSEGNCLLWQDRMDTSTDYDTRADWF